MCNTKNKIFRRHISSFENNKHEETKKKKVKSEESIKNKT